MTQDAIDRIWSFLGRVFPAAHEPAIALDSPSGALEGESADDDCLRAYRDESYYWGWCVHGHW